MEENYTRIKVFFINPMDGWYIIHEKDFHVKKKKKHINVNTLRKDQI